MALSTMRVSASSYTHVKHIPNNILYFFALSFVALEFNTLDRLVKNNIVNVCRKTER